MKRLLISMLVLGFMTSMTVLAKDVKKAPATAKPKVEAPAKYITVTGKIAKIEAKKKGAKAKFQLITAKGKIDLPETKIDLVKMVGKEVTVVGNGKDDGKKIHLKSIKSVGPKTVKGDVVKAADAVKADVVKAADAVKDEAVKAADDVKAEVE